MLITEIAVRSKVTVGKWMIFRQRAMINETWEMIAEATVAGKLGCSSKVVSSFIHVYVHECTYKKKGVISF